MTSTPSFVYHLGAVDQGAHNIVRQVLALKPGEKLVVITDRYAGPLMQPVCRAAESIVGRDHVARHFLEDLGPRDREAGLALNSRQVAAGPAFQRLLAEVQAAAAGIYAAVSLGDEMILRRSLVQAGVANQGRFLLLPNLTADIMGMGFCADQAAAQEYTEAMARLARRARAAEVTTPAGTRAWAWFGLDWVVAGSILAPGQWANVGAEIYTCPVAMDGTWVTDGGMGDIFNRYGTLAAQPLRLEIKSGVVVQAVSDRPGLAEEFRRYAASDRQGQGFRVGEFALATNPELTELGLIGVNMQDEKVLPHIATGDSRREWTMTGRIPEAYQWTSDVHVDLTVRDATVTLHLADGKTVVVLQDGQPTEAVFAEMQSRSGRLQERLQAIAEHRRRNDGLAPEKREKIVRF